MRPQWKLVLFSPTFCFLVWDTMVVSGWWSIINCLTAHIHRKVRQLKFDTCAGLHKQTYSSGLVLKLCYLPEEQSQVQLIKFWVLVTVFPSDLNQSERYFSRQETDLIGPFTTVKTTHLQKATFRAFYYCLNYKLSMIDPQTVRPHKEQVHFLLSMSGGVISVVQSIVPWPLVRNHGWFNGRRLTGVSRGFPSSSPHSHCLGHPLPCQLYCPLSPARHV